MITALLATAALSFLLTEVVAYSVHRLAHWPKSGKLFRDHMYHHAHTYPPSRYQTERYLGDLKTSFLPVFIPLFTLVNVLGFIFLPWPCYTVFFVVTSVGSLANSYLHDSFHVSIHWLRRFRWYGRMTKFHRVHHENVKMNLGIYWYGLDRLLKSFKLPSNL
jgi:sterol desaturase/sphingolipid hydroxylase (fatty acid hydroxylase superfamily)